MTDKQFKAYIKQIKKMRKLKAQEAKERQKFSYLNSQFHTDMNNRIELDNT
jgi:hypothetical protein